MAVYIIGLALMGALIFGLRYWDKRTRAQGSLLPAPDDAGDCSLADNLEFGADVAMRMARRGKSDDRADEGGSDGGGDGGG